jgi:hypothetical protein
VGHNPSNNPNDDSHWELLCMYYDNEAHNQFENLVRYQLYWKNGEKNQNNNPLADLKERMKRK